MAQENGAAPDMVAVSVDEWERVTSNLVALASDNRSLKWILAILLARLGNEVTVTAQELATAESDDILTMEQTVEHHWVIRRESALDAEGSPE